MDHPLISPCDCKHFRAHLIEESRSGPPSRRHCVTVCRDCGEFTVTAFQDGVHTRITVTLSTPTSIEAACRYLKYLESEGD